MANGDRPDGAPTGERVVDRKVVHARYAEHDTDTGALEDVCDAVSACALVFFSVVSGHGRPIPSSLGATVANARHPNAGDELPHGSLPPCSQTIWSRRAPLLYLPLSG
jgi:hypothetical protein